MLTRGQERRLAMAIREHGATNGAANGAANDAANGADPTIGANAAVEDAVEAAAAAERACTTCALLSGWPSLEAEGLAALQAPSSPPPDTALLRLLVDRGELPALSKTPYWTTRALGVLSTHADAALFADTVCALGAARLYGPAGSVVLHARRTHPALHSPAAQLAALQAYVRAAQAGEAQAEDEADGGGGAAGTRQERALRLRALHDELRALADGGGRGY
jgi:hypothetical protein